MDGDPRQKFVMTNGGGAVEENRHEFEAVVGEEVMLKREGFCVLQVQAQVGEIGVGRGFV